MDGCASGAFDDGRGTRADPASLHPVRTAGTHPSSGSAMNR